MDALVQYSIPVKGLHNGTHEYRFEIDHTFFACFENSPVEDGKVAVSLEFDKRPGLFVLEFDLAGTVKTDCDRCLAKIDLPIADQQRLLVKFSEVEEPEEADVVFVSPDIQQLNVAKFIYEFIVLALPIIKVFDCQDEEPRVCNDEMLDYLEGKNDEPSSEPTNNPLWDELKGFRSEK